MTLDLRGTTALVTGASAGLGTHFARQLATRGADLVLIARREDRLRALADELRADHGVSVLPLAFDLGKPDAARELRRQLDERGLEISTLINNAGFGMKGPFVDADRDHLDAMVQLNVTAVVDLTREFLPDLVRVGRGALVNVASTAAYQPCPSMAVYGATKAFVLSFTEAIAYETRDSGLRVLAISPGPTRTEFFDVVGTEGAAVGGFQSPQEVVQRALRTLDRKRPRASVVSGRLNALGARAVSLVPRRLALAISGHALR